jgi:ribosomal protein S18 acetylase RimI-like enzyme
MMNELDLKIPYNKSSIRICRFSELSSADKSKTISAIQYVFFLSATKKNFANESEKKHFFEKWTAYYFDHCEEYIYVANSSDKIPSGQNRFLGYLMGTNNSRAAITWYQDRVPYYSLFEDQFELFPAHLHINCHPDARGLGIGTQMIETFVGDLKIKKSKGVHLITSPDQRNVQFYKRCGFTTTLQRPWNKAELLFMGRSIG